MEAERKRVTFSFCWIHGRRREGLVGGMRVGSKGMMWVVRVSTMQLSEGIKRE